MSVVSRKPRISRSKWPLLSLLILGGLFGFTANATGPTNASSASSADTCLACHGDAVRTSMQAPQLAGLSQPYLYKQLLQFQNGERGAADPQGQQMAALANTLTAADIEALSRHFSAQPAVQAKGAVSAQQQDQGRRLYIGSCGTCHGNQAQGNAALHAPALQQDAAYLARQLQLFRSGQRGQHKTDKPGRQMAMMTRTLSDSDIDAVAAYIGAGLP